MKSASHATDLDKTSRAMASFLDEELCCPVCCEYFTDPVILGCSHSFCKTCIQKCWSYQSFRKTCPVCKRICISEKPPANLVLRNIVESVKGRKQSQEKETEQPREKRQEPQETKQQSTQSKEGQEARCSVHGERLFFFCKEDQEVLCMVCQVSEKHKNHQINPVEEAAQELKEKVRVSLGSFKDDLMIFQKKKDECLKTTQHIKEQTRVTKDLIKKDFEQLHHFLRLEEAARVSALEDEDEMKRGMMKRKLDGLSNDIKSLTNIIQAKDRDLERDDIHFLQAYKSYNDSAASSQQGPVLMSDALIDVAKHVGNLKFKVWEKMLVQVQYSPVIMNPNSAAPWLRLSENLTSVQYGNLQSEIPDNPERCDLCVCVLGNETIGPGTHCWEVDVGSKTKWDLGLVMESVSRKGILNVNCESGFWAVALREGGQYSACTKPWTRLNLKRKPHRIRICLNNDDRELSFYDPLDMTKIYTFTQLPTDKVIPFFSPCVGDQGNNTEPLRIFPVKVEVSITSDPAD